MRTVACARGGHRGCAIVFTDDPAGQDVGVGERIGVVQREHPAVGQSKDRHGMVVDANGHPAVRNDSISGAGDVPLEGLSRHCIAPSGATLTTGSRRFSSMVAGRRCPVP